MRIFVDADSCPVTDAAVSLAQKFGYECILVSDEIHAVRKRNAVSIIVPVGNDSADEQIIIMVKRNDIVITDDTGLAGICEGKGAVILNHLAEIYCSDMLYVNNWIISRKRRKALNAVHKRRRIFIERFSKLLEAKRDAEWEKLRYLNELRHIKEQEVIRYFKAKEEIKRKREQARLKREQEQAELKLAKERRYKAKLKRRKERALQKQRAAEELKEKPMDIIELFFQHEKGKRDPKNKRIIY